MDPGRTVRVSTLCVAPLLRSSLRGHGTLGRLSPRPAVSLAHSHTLVLPIVEFARIPVLLIGL